jgi:hypothetical protein
MGFGDPAQIMRLAARVRSEADLTRADAGRGGSADGVQWKSLAADSYRKELSDALQLARAAAGELDELAQALLRHATAVQKRLDQIAAAERWLRDQADGAAQQAKNLASNAVDDVSDSLGLAQQKAKDLGREVGRLVHGHPDWFQAAVARGWTG